MNIRFTPAADAQFLAAIAYIRRENPSAAMRFRRQVEKSLGRLARFPKSGSTLPEFPHLPYREVFVAPYRFFYKVEEETIWIVAVWHGARVPHEPTE